MNNWLFSSVESKRHSLFLKSSCGPMSSTTTAADIFTLLVGSLDRVGMNWSHAVSLATDGAPSMIFRKAGVVTMFREKVMQKQNLIFGLFTVFYTRKLCAASH